MATSRKSTLSKSPGMDPCDVAIVMYGKQHYGKSYGAGADF